MGAQRDAGAGAGAQRAAQDAAILPQLSLAFTRAGFVASRWEWAAALFDCYLFMAVAQYSVQAGQEAICRRLEV